nr:TPA_asm: RNA-dependent RNA polymerase [Alphaendornavirus fimbriatae-3]
MRRVMNNGTDVFSDGPLAAVMTYVTSILMDEYGTCHIEPDSAITVADSASLGPFSYTVPSWCEQSRLTWATSSTIARKMLERFRSRVPASDVRHGRLADLERSLAFREGTYGTVSGDVQRVVTPHVLSLAPNDLSRHYSNYAGKTYSFVTRDIVRTAHGSGFVLPHSDRLFLINKHQLASIEDGRMIAGTDLRWHTIDNFEGLRLLRLSKQRLWARNTTQHLADATVKMPTINITLPELARTGELFTHSTLRINKNFMTNLRKRLLLKPTDREDLYAYARTMMQTAVYMTTGAASKRVCTARDVEGMVHLALIMNSYEQVAFSGTKIGSYADAELKDNMIALLARLCDDGKRNVDAVVAQLSSMVPHVSDLARSYRDIAAVFNDIMRHLSSVDGDFMAGDEMITPRGSATMRPRIKHLQRVNLNDKHGAIAGKDEFAGTRPSDNFYSDLIEDPAAANVERFARLGRGDAHCEPRWTHALMGSGKFAVGRDWLAFKNTHWVSSKYLNQPALSTTQQRFLSTLSNAVDKLEHADSYHLYSLCDGIASRSPATAGPGRNLHVNIGASGSYDPLGFVSILRSDPGRFGACARVIVAHMLVTRRQGCTVYIRSGRPGPHVYWAEAALAETDDERLSMGNTVALPFTTFGPFLDGMRIVSPLQNMDGFVKNNMNYYWLYGIDEADHTVFNIKTTLTWERATFPYSNWFFHDDRENVMHGIDAVTVATRAPGALTDELVIEGTRNPENMGSLIKLHDRAHSGPTRSGDSPSALASAWAAGGKAPRGDVNKKWLPYRTTNRGTGCIEVYRGTASPGTVVYDPHTDGQCVWHCFAHYARHAADWDDARIVQAYQSLAPKTFETVQDIAKYGVAMGFSTSVTTPDGEYYSVQIDGSPSLCLHVKYTMGTYFHCTIVEQHTITEQRRQREDTIDVAGLSAAAGNARLAQRLIRDGLSGRAGGDVANAIEATRGPIWPRAVVIAQNPDLRTKGRDGTDEFMQVSGAQPASVIAIPGSEGLDFKVAFEHAGRVWIEHPYTDVYIALSLRCSVDSLVARNARDDKPALVDVSGTTDAQPSFINHTSKTNAAPELQHHVVDSAGRPLIVVDFDNTNHHGSAAHDDLAARGFDALILPGEHMDEQTCDELATQGMLIAGVTGGKLRYRTCTINDDLAAAVYYDSGVHHEQRPTKAALEAYNQGWAQTRVGNRYGLGPACNDDACPCNQVADSLNATGRARLELGRAESRALLACTGETSFDLTHRTDTHTRLQWVFQLNTGDSECEIYEYAADKWMSTFDVFAVGSGHMLVSEFAAHVNSKAYYDYKTGRTTKTERAPEPRPNMNDRVDAVKHALGDSGSAHTISAEAPTRREYEYIEHMDASVELLTDEYHERIAAKTMDYWDNNTALLPTVAPTPHDAVKFNVKEHDIELKTVGKAILTPYPSHAQPNYTKRYHAMQQAAVDLFGKSFKLRQVEHDPEADARELVRTYFTRSVPSTEIITFDARATAEWIAERPGADNIRRELDELLDEGWATHPINRVNVHIKLESRLKDKPHNAADIGMPATISEQRVRLIVWQPKAMTALFAPIFHEAKKRLKACLRRDVIYTDGMSPPELSAVLSTYDGSGALFVEDDLEKQDRQTDMTLIKTEMLIYKWLGVDPRVVDMWQRVHEHWSAKGYSISFDGHASRQTGQATTSIGNTIVNMLVHMRFVKTLGQNLVIMMCLGDDNLMVCRGHVTENMVSQNSARHFNMKSKPSVSKTHGGFLRMIVTTRSNGTLMCGPDFIRLRRKYEVTNGVSEATVENLQARGGQLLRHGRPRWAIPESFPPWRIRQPAVVVRTTQDHSHDGREIRHHARRGRGRDRPTFQLRARPRRQGSHNRDVCRQSVKKCMSECKEMNVVEVAPRMRSWPSRKSARLPSSSSSPSSGKSQQRCLSPECKEMHVRV